MSCGFPWILLRHRSHHPALFSLACTSANAAVTLNLITQRFSSSSFCFALVFWPILGKKYNFIHTIQTRPEVFQKRSLKGNSIFIENFLRKAFELSGKHLDY
jgi:hypothetical protein